MAKVAKRQVKLSEVPMVQILKSAVLNMFTKVLTKGKRILEDKKHFIFWSEEAKQEKTFERFKFSLAKVKQISEKEYEW